jgi:hypothetical protein
LGEFRIGVTVARIIVGGRRLVGREAEFRFWLRGEKIVSGRFIDDLLFGGSSSRGGIPIL